MASPAERALQLMERDKKIGFEPAYRREVIVIDAMVCANRFDNQVEPNWTPSNDHFWPFCAYWTVGHLLRSNKSLQIASIRQQMTRVCELYENTFLVLHNKYACSSRFNFDPKRVKLCYYYVVLKSVSYHTDISIN